MTWKQPIPVHAARAIAEQYGYDQVIIIARKVDPDGGEHCTTYGRDKAHCDVAARCGDFLKYKVMGWHQEAVEPLAKFKCDFCERVFATVEVRADHMDACVGVL